MQIRVQWAKSMRIRADLDPDYWLGFAVSLLASYKVKVWDLGAVPYGRYGTVLRHF